MSSVTGRIAEIKQPRGGYIKLAQLNLIQLNDNKELNTNENLHVTVMD